MGICREGLGVEYTEDVDTHSKQRPMSIFFEAAPSGRVSAFSIRAWFSNSSFYNSDTWKLPPFGVSEEGERMVTITTREASSVCAAYPHHEKAKLGDRLIVNVDQAGQGLLIPTTVPPTPDGAWKFGACQSDMSRHWGYPLSGDANDLYGFDHGVHVLPVIPMFSVPEGDNAGVTALAFFTTEPQVTYSNGGIWDATVLLHSYAVEIFVSTRISVSMARATRCCTCSLWISGRPLRSVAQEDRLIAVLLRKRQAVMFDSVTRLIPAFVFLCYLCNAIIYLSLCCDLTGCFCYHPRALDII